MPSPKLVWRNIVRRPVRAILTIGSLTIAIFLICGLRTLITTCLLYTSDAADE